MILQLVCKWLEMCLVPLPAQLIPKPPSKLSALLSLGAGQALGLIPQEKDPELCWVTLSRTGRDWDWEEGPGCDRHLA